MQVVMSHHPRPIPRGTQVSKASAEIPASELRKIVSKISAGRGASIHLCAIAFALAADTPHPEKAKLEQAFDVQIHHLEIAHEIIAGTTDPDGLDPDHILWVRKALHNSDLPTKNLKVFAKLAAAFRGVMECPIEDRFEQTLKVYTYDIPEAAKNVTEVIRIIWTQLDTDRLTRGSELGQLRASLDQSVGDILRVANHVRMISLNAAVEAARAGDAGRGFAVIASEIKLLSEKIKSSSDEAEAFIADLRRLKAL